MGAQTPQLEASEMRESVLHWLLDSDPSIRWQVLRDLMHESGEAVAAERSRVASKGWGSRLLGLQGSDGQWGGAPYVCPGWISTTDTLLLLRDLKLLIHGSLARPSVTSLPRGRHRSEQALLYVPSVVDWNGFLKPIHKEGAS